jgi:ketosteroid isomerase-like protein
VNDRLFLKDKILLMRKIWLLTAALLFVLNTAFAQAADEKAVRNVLAQQTKDWNNGDTKNFMNSYWKSDSLMFVGKSGVTYGWQQTLDNYNKHYPDTASMGKLDFNLLSVKRLAADYFFVIGKWHLARSIGDIGGSFTLLFRKFKNQWLIVADHSS